MGIRVGAAKRGDILTIRERILAGFRDLAFDVGFYRATMDDLSARTGISKRTIYRYFRSKDELVDAVVDELISGAEQRVFGAMDSSDHPVDRIVNMVSALSRHLRVLSPVIMGDMQRYYPQVWARIDRFRSEKARKVVEMLITGNRQGYFRESVPEVFITSLQAAIRDVVSPGFILKHNLTVDKTVTALFDIFLYGIVAEEARPGNDKGPLPPKEEAHKNNLIT